MCRLRREHHDSDGRAGGCRERREAAGPAADDGRADAADEELARQLAERAQAEGLSLTGPGGLLGRLTKVVLEGALDGEMDAHLGYARHDPAGRMARELPQRQAGQDRAHRCGPGADRGAPGPGRQFEPQIVAKRQRRLGGVDDMVISLVAKGLTTGEVQAHLAEIYGVEVSRETISKITDRVLEGLAEWQSRPLDAVYAVMFIDVINVKIRDGNVANRPIYVALAVTADGERDVLGLWAGEHGDGEGAKYWLRVLTEIKNRGTADVLMVVCDGLKGLPDAIGQVWPQAVTQTCIVHLLRNSFRYASKQDWGRDRQRPQAGLHRRVRSRGAGRVRRVQRDMGEAVPGDHPAVGERLGRVRPVPGLRPGNQDHHLHDQRHRELNARFRRSVKARGHFPTEQAALKHLYLTVVSLDPTGRGRQRWSNRWKGALNAFDITFDGRLSAGRK